MFAILSFIFTTFFIIHEINLGGGGLLPFVSPRARACSAPVISATLVLLLRRRGSWHCALRTSRLCGRSRVPVSLRPLSQSSSKELPCVTLGGSLEVRGIGPPT